MSTLQFQLRQRRASLRRMLFLLHYLKTIATALMEYLIFLAKTSAEIAAFLISSQMNLQQNYKKKNSFQIYGTLVLYLLWEIEYKAKFSNKQS